MTSSVVVAINDQELHVREFSGNGKNALFVFH